VVVRPAFDGERIESGRGRFVIAQARARCDVVEDLDDLGAQAAGVLTAAAERVLARDASLLVRGRAQRDRTRPAAGDA